MIHPAELSVHAFLRSAINGKASMSEEVIQQVATDVAAALNKQFNGGPREEFRLRMSNIGRPGANFGSTRTTLRLTYRSLLLLC